MGVSPQEYMYFMKLPSPVYGKIRYDMAEKIREETALNNNNNCRNINELKKFKEE